MKRFFVVLLVLSLASVFLATTLGVFAGKEIGGRERFYLGATFKTDDLLGLGIDVMHPVKDFSTATEELSDVDVLELNPLLYLNFGQDTKIYIGVGPIIIMDIETYDFSLYSKDILRGKAGISMNLGMITLFAEGVTAFSYSPFATTGIYGIQGGIGLNF